MNKLGTSCLLSLVLSTTATAQLAGSYTVNPTWPASPSNFASLADATIALAAQGVIGPVFLFLYDDAGPYTEASSFTTVNGPFPPQTAVLVMSSWTGTSSVNRVTFLPAPGELPVFDAANRSMGVFWGGADFVTVKGIEIKNAIHDAISLYAETSHGIALDPIIDGCRLHDCGGTGVTIYGNSSQPANTLVQNCTFWRLQLTNAGSFDTTARFGYVTARKSNGTRIVHNTFIADTGAGSWFCILGAYPSGTEVPYVEVSNNIFVKSVNTAAPIFRINSPAGAAVPVPVVCDSNCFFDTSGGPFALWGASSSTVSATLLDWQITALRDLTSIQGDPVFRDAAARDYHLQPLSPCLSASTVAAGVTADFDGQPRLAALEIGADEFSAATWTSVGTGCPGTGSLVPVLRNNWPFLGNPAYTLRTEQVPPGTVTVLFGSAGLGLVPLPFAGCLGYLDLPTLSSLAVAIVDPAGTSSIVYALPSNPVFIGVNLAFQSLVLDAGVPAGLTLSNALDVTFDF